MHYFTAVLSESWHILSDSSVYVIFGIVAAGMLKVFLKPSTVAGHLGSGRFSSVFKAALLGVPLPLCSCGVLPAAASLKKQGANNGAVASFLISTPESGVDSIALTYALMDPIMTVARPGAAFAAAVTAGITENLLHPPAKTPIPLFDLSRSVDSCCNGTDCSSEAHQGGRSFRQQVKAGLVYAFGEVWGDLAVWFFTGLLLAGVISVLLPMELASAHLGGGLGSMMIMLVIGIPFYICATASTPIAATFLLKGVSPGAALVFLLVGPATNITSLTVLPSVLGKRGTAIYLASLSLVAVLSGLALDSIYSSLGISARAVLGKAAELVPHELGVLGAVLLLLISVNPVRRKIVSRFPGRDESAHRTGPHGLHSQDSQINSSCSSGSSCGCSNG